ncbi:hypothetical protein QBC39DRAFT_179373 [Podospora conica]|nr:hypothetical protein QBC39DRAFT_179373 [Schizothecium conicum]
MAPVSFNFIIIIPPCHTAAAIPSQRTKKKPPRCYHSANAREKNPDHPPTTSSHHHPKQVQSESTKHLPSIKVPSIGSQPDPDFSSQFSQSKSKVWEKVPQIIMSLALFSNRYRRCDFAAAPPLVLPPRRRQFLQAVVAWVMFFLLLSIVCVAYYVRLSHGRDTFLPKRP